MKMYYDADVDTDALEGKTIAVISYYLMKPKKKFTKNKSLLMLKLETLFHSLTVTTYTLD